MTQRYHTGPRPNARGPRPHVWVTGPDPVEHAKYRVFIQQKNQANYRKEPWTVSFEEWKAIWGELWHQRGRERGCYCMTRADHTEGWTKENIRVVSRDEHARDQARLASAGYRSPAREAYRQKTGKTIDKKSGPKGPRTKK